MGYPRVKFMKALVETNTKSALGELSVIIFFFKLLVKYPSSTCIMKRIISINTNTFYIIWILRNFLKKLFLHYRQLQFQKKLMVVFDVLESFFVVDFTISLNLKQFFLAFLIFYLNHINEIYISYIRVSLIKTLLNMIHIYEFNIIYTSIFK